MIKQNYRTNVSYKSDYNVNEEMDEIIDLIKTGNNSQLEKKLKENPSLSNGKTELGISILQYAAYCRNNDAVGILMKFKRKLDIFEAACVGDNITVNHLLDINPELIQSFSVDGFTVLGLASFFGHLSLVKLLLVKGANPNIASNNQLKVAPIHSACAVSNFEIAELLIKNGADVNAKQVQGFTPLHSAAYNGKSILVKLLLDNGADINAKMDNGQTPLFMALEKNFKEIADLIKSHGGH